MVSYIDILIRNILFLTPQKKDILFFSMEMIPYDKRSGKIWFNGKTINWKDAQIHVLNHGLHYASCVFEEKFTTKYLNSKSTQKDYFIVLKEWE